MSGGAACVWEMRLGCERVCASMRACVYKHACVGVRDCVCDHACVWVRACMCEHACVGVPPVSASMHVWG